MIIHHRTNVGGFAGAHVWYWPTQPLVSAFRIGAPGGAAADELIAQARALHRFVLSRVFGRVN